jgi:hypothetical protein
MAGSDSTYRNANERSGMYADGRIISYRQFGEAGAEARIGDGRLEGATDFPYTKKEQILEIV